VARRFPVRLVELPDNRGPSAARNAGLRATSADVIGWLDSDDLWLPDHVETVAGLLERFPSAGVAFGLMERFGTDQGLWRTFIPEYEPSDASHDSFEYTVSPICSTLVRRSL